MSEELSGQGLLVFKISPRNYNAPVLELRNCGSFLLPTHLQREVLLRIKKPKSNHDGLLDRKIGQQKELQARTPWHRDGTDQPPVSRMRSAGAMTKGICSVFLILSTYFFATYRIARTSFFCND